MAFRTSSFSAPRKRARNDKKHTKARRLRGYRPLLETLEDRTMPTVVPHFLGTFSLSAGPDVNISRTAGNQTEGTIAVDPLSPNRVYAASLPGTTAGISTNAGASFTRFNGSVTAADIGDDDAVWDSFGNLFLVYIDIGPDGAVGG